VRRCPKVYFLGMDPWVKVIDQTIPLSVPAV
jgi:hypothetical protein